MVLRLILTGPPGAGKSTVARLLAKEMSGPVVHMHTDDFYAWIAKGYVAPWKVEARAQNLAVLAAIRDAALVFAAAGYGVIVDGIVGPWFLEPFLGRGFDYVVLRPSEAETLARGTARQHVMTDAAVIGQIWRAFADLGAHERHAFDTSLLTPEDAAAELRRRLPAGAFRLD